MSILKILRNAMLPPSLSENVPPDRPKQSRPDPNWYDQQLNAIIETVMRLGYVVDVKSGRVIGARMYDDPGVREDTDA